ncbi:hypothetical protein U1Q18_028976 [Sarracenia purpurea var. burkii]
MEKLAMLKLLIDQVKELKELLDLNGADHPYCLHLHPRTQLLPPPPPLPQPPPLQQYNSQRWCFFSLNDNSSEDGYYSSIVRARKPEIFMVLEPCEPPPAKKSRNEQNQGRIVNAAISTENMEQQIWKDFPEDLFEAVIARLPIATFFRFRTVCRKWNSLLTSHSFSQKCSQIPQSQPWFFTMTCDNFTIRSMYDPSLEKWHHSLLPNLPPESVFLPVASAGGLVCLLDISHRRICVCNPLTQSFKELPATLVGVSSRVTFGMTLNGEGYKVLWLRYDGEYEVYDSIKNSWTGPGIVPPSVELPLSLNYRSQAVSIGGTLYFMCFHPDAVLSYDTLTEVWNHFLIPDPPHLHDRALAECGGRIMLVGLLTKNAATCVYVWELQKMTLLWKEVDRMPNIWCLEFYGEHVGMTCLCNKDLLLLSLRSRQMNQLVTYNLLSGEWLKVPGCTPTPGGKHQWVAIGTAFYPCLTASA